MPTIKAPAARLYLVQMTVPAQSLQMIFELVRQQDLDFGIKVINPPMLAPLASVPTPDTRPPIPAPWTAEKYWPLFRRIMRSARNHTISYNDRQLLTALQTMRRKRTNPSPMWTAYVRQGKVSRVAHGRYRLAKENR